MSTRNEAWRSVHVRTIFAAMAAAFFPHSGSALRRPASSSKNSFVKYWTMDGPPRFRSSPDWKKPRLVSPRGDREGECFTHRGRCAGARGERTPVKGEELKIPCVRLALV